MILKCNCKHDYQDRTYGVGNRVHNPCKPEGSGAKRRYKAVRCTVCGDLKGVES